MTLDASGPVPAGVLAQVLDRAADPDGHARWSALVAQTGYCSHPIWLAGSVTAVDTATGEARTMYDSAGEPDGVLLTSCNNRRASVCPSCAETYRADTYQLVAAGLRGGKGLPASVAAHPRLFLTLTAPSFGPVHTRRTDRTGRSLPCRPRRTFGVCAHGLPTSCTARHRDDDPALGTPICPDCYDYEGAVLFNAHAPELWRRLTVYLRRDLARLAGMTQARLREQVRIRFAKVAEGQRRGLVHFHAVLRLDAAHDNPSVVEPPPVPFTADLLADAIRAAAARVAVTTAPTGEDAPGVRLQWGRQLDVRIIQSAGEGLDAPQLDETAVAAYLAKYVTKATAHTGIADRPLTREDVDRLDVAEHLDRMALTAWALGALGQFEDLRLRRWAHMLGFRGHVATRSRGYSTTLGALRRARRDWRVRQRHGDAGPRDPWGRPLGVDDQDPDGEATTLLVGQWRFAGVGHKNLGDAWLAETAAARAREQKAWARIDRLAFPDQP